MACKASLIKASASLAPVDRDVGIGEDSLEDQLYLAALPLLWQRKLGLVESVLVGDALGRTLTVETHPVLVGAEPLKLPARGNANLRPLAAITSVGALEVPFHHVVAAVAAKV